MCALSLPTPHTPLCTCLSVQVFVGATGKHEPVTSHTSESAGREWRPVSSVEKNAMNSMRWCGNGDLPVSSFPAGEFKCLHRNSPIPLTHDVVPSEPSLMTLLLNAELRESGIITILWCALESEFSHGCLSTNTISRRSSRAWSSSVNDKRDSGDCRGLV